jgi:hypothetical protein
MEIRTDTIFCSRRSKWSVLSNIGENSGEKICRVCRIKEKENPDLDGVLTNTKYNESENFKMTNT